MSVCEAASALREARPGSAPPIVHDELSTLLRPVQSAGPALFMALTRCLAVLYSGDNGEARLAAIAQAENVLRLCRRA